MTILKELWIENLQPSGHGRPSFTIFWHPHRRQIWCASNSLSFVVWHFISQSWYGGLFIPKVVELPLMCVDMHCSWNLMVPVTCRPSLFPGVQWNILLISCIISSPLWKSHFTGVGNSRFIPSVSTGLRFSSALPLHSGPCLQFCIPDTHFIIGYVSFSFQPTHWHFWVRSHFSHFLLLWLLHFHTNLLVLMQTSLKSS